MSHGIEFKNQEVRNLAVITIISEVKKIHPKEIALVKIGEFFHAYGKDSYILSYLFGYKLKTIEQNCSTCGFPQKSLAKVQSKLENKKINYIILDRRNNYDVDEFVNHKNLNNYDQIFEKAHLYVNIKRRIETIYSKLTKDINSKDIKEKIQQIENIIK